MTIKLHTQLIVATVLMLALASCSNAAASAPEASPVGETPTARAAEMLRLFGGYSADFEPLATTEEIEETSDIVFSGTITDVMPGPVVGNPNDKLSDIRTMVLTIGNVVVSSGSLPTNNNGFIYLDIVSPYSLDQSEFTTFVPIGTNMVAYASLYKGPAGSGIPVTDLSAGRPLGQALFVPSHPQGLVLDASTDDSGELVWPLVGSYAEMLLEEALPGGAATGAEE